MGDAQRSLYRDVILESRGEPASRWELFILLPAIALQTAECASLSADQTGSSVTQLLRLSPCQFSEDPSQHFGKIFHYFSSTGHLVSKPEEQGVEPCLMREPSNLSLLGQCVRPGQGLGSLELSRFGLFALILSRPENSWSVCTRHSPPFHWLSIFLYLSQTESLPSL